MQLTQQQTAMLEGDFGPATRKAMQILSALGKIYGAEHMLPVTSVQIAGVSYDNLGEAGLGFLDEMASGGGQARVLATLNPAGMDVEDWPALEIDPEFAAQQQRVIEAFTRMGVVASCTCTPYLAGNVPHFGEHIAWAESSAVCYANAVLGARTNREGGPSALATALTGFTPAYGLHLPENRRPTCTVRLETALNDPAEFGALGQAAGLWLQNRPEGRVPYITGLEHATLEQLKALCASIATYGGAALFHIPGVTPEASQYSPPALALTLTRAEIDAALAAMDDTTAADEIDFVSLGCPHLSLAEMARLAALLDGKQVKKTFWITTSRLTKLAAERMGYAQTITASGAIIAADTCCVVAPIRGRFQALATDSAKACYYAASKNRFKTRVLPFERVVEEALK